MCNDKFQASGTGAEAAKVTLGKNGAFTIERNAPTVEAAQRLSDFLNSLEALTSEQHNEIVKLTIATIIEAEKGAFLAGAGTVAAVLSDNESEASEPGAQLLQ